MPVSRQLSGQKSAEKSDEIYQTHIVGTDVDDSQFVTLKLVSGNFLRFQVHTGAQCNVVPKDFYKKRLRIIISPMSHTMQAYNHCIWR